MHGNKSFLLSPDLQGSTRTEAQGSEHKIEVPDVKKHCRLTGNINSKIFLFLHPCWSCTERKSCQTSWTQSTIRRLAFFLFFSINVHISKEFWQPPCTHRHNNKIWVVYIFHQKHRLRGLSVSSVCGLCCIVYCKNLCSTHLKCWSQIN